MPVNLTYPNQFDPSQLKNPYTRWAGVGLPSDYMQEIGPSGLYGGTAPTNAYGQDIPSYTAAAAQAQAQYAQQQAAYQQRLAAYNAGGGAQGTQINNTGANAQSGLDDILGAMGMTQQGQQMAAKGMTPQDIATFIGLPGLQNIGGQQAAAPTGQGGAPTPPSMPNMTQAYLAALQKPPAVKTPGANVPEAQLPSTASNVLQQFVANWKPGVNPAGNYNNQPTIDAMRMNV